MSQTCAIKTCKRASRTLCHCCNQNLCRDHFNEHDDLLNSQLNPLIDEINSLADRLTALNLDKVTDNCRQKLNQWRTDYHKIIDRLYDRKCQELDRYVVEQLDGQRKETIELRSKMTELIDRQETTKNHIDSLSSAIRTLERNMNKIEQIPVQVNIRSLAIDDSLIQIGESEVHQFDLLTLPPPYRTIDCLSKNSSSLASNDRFLLVYICPNLCLIDQGLSIIKQKEWKHIDVEDMCWSSTLNCFFVTTSKNVYLVNEKTMSIQSMQTEQGQNWNACGCSDKSLYLSRDAWDSSVLELSLLPTIQFVKLWKTGVTKKEEKQIDSIVYNHGTLAFSINDRSNQTKFIELRTLDTFHLLWSLRLNVFYNDNLVRCCLLNNEDWLVADWCASRLFHITNNGKLQGTCAPKFVPYNANLFNGKILAILTDRGINFHKL